MTRRKEGPLLPSGKPRRFTDEEELEIAEEYLTGVGAPTLARRFGCSHPTVYSALRRAGVSTRDRPISKGFTVSGYKWVRVDGEDDICWPMVHHRGQKAYPFVMEHRVVMARSIGRPLRSHENVHHRDGDKANNALENLELWTTSQPSGQRVDEKIEWAIAFLAEYGYTVAS